MYLVAHSSRSLLSLLVCRPPLYSEHAHALNWAIVDVTGKKYYADPVLDRATPEILRKQLADGTYDLDQRMSRAFVEVVNKSTCAHMRCTHALADVADARS
jgi:hypothetical protein